LVTDRSLDGARRLLGQARNVVFLTGAGISAESGVPTFRGSGGLWNSRRPEELATPEAFRRDPRLVWEWYAWRRGVVAACAPNPGHLSLARFLHARRREAILVTQNVDGLHRLAAIQEAGRGEPAAALPLELHGSLFRDRCSGCGVVREAAEPVDARSEATLPRCEACGSLLRPDVVWFGEPLDPGVFGAAHRAASGAEVCVVIGTSALVHPAASLPLATLAARGSVVEINPEETPLTRRASHALRGPAAELVPRMLDPDRTA
jgi:NAD-dependent deacetylase